MNIKYRLLTFVILGLVGFWPGQRAQAQVDYSGSFTECPSDQSECLIEYSTDAGLPVANALINTIENDENRPDDRVYKLERGGFYYVTDPIQNSGFHLRIEGQTADEAEANGQDDAFVCGDGDDDCGPALIQRVNTSDGGDAPGNMFESNGDLTLHRIWLMGVTRSGAFGGYGPLKMQAQGATYTFDEVYFDRLYWHHLHAEASDVNIIVKNSRFRNLVNNTQRWEGLGIRLDAGADSVVFENNSFFNIGFTPFQSEAAPAEYFRFNHNTVINPGRSFSAGAIWQTAYVTNNIFVNGFWQGEDETQYGNPQRVDDYAGFFTIAPLPPQFGTEATRRVVFNNNLFTRDPAFNEYYESVDPIIRPQPMINDTTRRYANNYESMVIENNYCMDGDALGCEEEVSQPDFANAPTGDVQIDSMIANISDVRAENTPTQSYFWDPGRQNPSLYAIWPVPEDFSYSSSSLQEAGTDDLPLGDLNWFPDAKQDFLNNETEYIADIADLAGAQQSVESVAFPEAESGTLLGNASMVQVEGFVNFYFAASGAIQWDFSLEEGGTYGLNINTHLEGNAVRGEDFLLDDVALINDDNAGELFFCTTDYTDGTCDHPLDTADDWTTYELRSDHLLDNTSTSVDETQGLTLDAGAHTLRIHPVWGYQSFADIEVVDEGGNVVQTLSPLDAVNEGATEECAEADFCPRGFTSVSLGAGDGVSVGFTAPQQGQYLFRAFYASSMTGTGAFKVDGEDVTSINIGMDTTSTISSAVDVGEGNHTLTFSSSAGGMSIDAIQILQLTSEGTDVDDAGSLPDGYALGQSYPNPFNATATIEYEMARPGDVRMDVYDLLGRRVRTLVSGTVTSGTHTVRFDGQGLASGIYFYRIETPVGQQVRKMTLVK